MSPRRVIYAGSFDPIHCGHLDLIERGAGLFEELWVAVGTNVSKRSLFDAKTRLDWVQRSTAHLGNVKVEGFSGLVVDFLADKQADGLLRGLRHGADLDAEAPMAQMNRQLQSRAETVFLLGDPKWLHLSSSLIKEVARFGGDISAFLPAPIRADVVAATAAAQP